jgi:hypothetical protein
VATGTVPSPSGECSRWGVGQGSCAKQAAAARRRTRRCDSGSACQALSLLQVVGRRPALLGCIITFARARYGHSRTCVWEATPYSMHALPPLHFYPFVDSPPKANIVPSRCCAPQRSSAIPRVARCLLAFAIKLSECTSRPGRAATTSYAGHATRGKVRSGGCVERLNMQDAGLELYAQPSRDGRLTLKFPVSQFTGNGQGMRDVRFLRGACVERFSVYAICARCVVRSSL